jgi:sulfur carrier protein
MIQISVNSQSQSIAPNTRLSDALIEWGFANSKIAVAINQEFVPRSTYSERILMNCDQIDIVKPVGGG